MKRNINTLFKTLLCSFGIIITGTTLTENRADQSYQRTVDEVRASIQQDDLARQNIALEKTRAMLASGKNVDNPDIAGLTNLAKALGGGEALAAMELIAHNANIHATGYLGFNMLHSAAAHPANLAIVKFLVKNNLNVNQKDSTLGITPLLVAIATKNREVFYYLMEHGAEINVKVKIFNITPLHLAALVEDLEICTYLLEKGADVNAEMSIGRLTPLDITAIRSQAAQTHVAFLDRTKNLDTVPDATSKTEGAAANKAIEQLLISRGGRKNLDITAFTLELLLFMTRTERIAEDPSCIDLGAHCPLINATQLHEAVCFNTPSNLEATKRLLAAGADTNVRDCVIGFTPLHFACTEATQILLEHGADANAKTTLFGLTPLYCTLLGKNTTRAELLLKYGADVNMRSDLFNATTLHLACLQKNEPAVQFLLEHGADANARMAGNITPLHITVSNNTPEITELLLKHGADKSLRDQQGKMPFDYEPLQIK